MTPRFLRRRIRQLWIAALANAAWSNRRDVARWATFFRRAVSQRNDRPVSDLITEAKVRLAVSADPLIRRDKALEDVSVADRVVTLRTSTAGWPDPRDQIFRIKKVKGITDVRSEMSAPAAV